MCAYNEISDLNMADFKMGQSDASQMKYVKDKSTINLFWTLNIRVKSIFQPSSGPANLVMRSKW